MIRVLGLGDNVVDDYTHIRTYYPGGNALNFSVYAKQLGCESAYLGITGDDEPAQHVFFVLQKLGIDQSRVRVIPGENGRAKVELRNGDRVFVGSNKGGVSRTTPYDLNQIDREYIKQFDLVHTSCHSFLDHLLPTISAWNSKLSYDFSIYFKEEHLHTICPYIQVAELSCSHMDELEIVRRIESIHTAGCPIVIATRGLKGVVVSIKGKHYKADAYPVEVIDSMGAGDSLITAFLIDLFSLYKQRSDYEVQGDAAMLEEFDVWFAINVNIALTSAVMFATKTCMKHGAFGYPKKY